MLSKENAAKVIFTGLYRCKPNEKYCYGDMYWCRNWTFRPVCIVEKDEWYMIDTYANKRIELTDDNFNEFKLVFDFKDVNEYKGPKERISDYNENDYFIEAVDSGGWEFPKMFVKSGAWKNKEHVLERLNNEVTTLERQLKQTREKYEKVKKDEFPWWEI